MQNKFFTYAILFFTLTINSCQKIENSYKNISDDYLKSLSTPNGYYVDVVIPVEKGRIVIFNTAVLFDIYDQYYQSKYPTSFDFLRTLYDGKIQDISQYFNGYTREDIDKSIMDEYEKYGLKYIIEKYLERTNDECYTFKKRINFTVAKIMFINNYYLYYDDYVPNYVFKLKLDDLAIPEDWQ